MARAEKRSVAGILRSFTVLELKNVRRDSPRKSTLSAMAGIAIQNGLRFVVTLIIGRLGGPYLLGVAATLIAIAQIGSLLGPTSVSAAASKYIAKAQGGEDATLPAVVARQLQGRFVLAVLIALSSSVGYFALNGPAADNLEIFVLAGLTFGYSAYSYARGVQYGAGRFVRATVFDAFTATIAIAAILIMLIERPISISILLPLAASYVLYLNAGLIRRQSGKVPRELRIEMDMFILLGIVGTLASAGFMNAAVIVARSEYGATGAGTYSAALSLATPLAMVAGSISMALFPILAHSVGAGNYAAFRATSKRYYQAAITLFPAVAGPIVILSPIIIATIWGPGFAESAPLLSILMAGTLANILGIVPSNALTAASLAGQKLSALIGIAGVFGGVFAWLLIPSEHGVDRIAYGYLVCALVLALTPSVIVGFRDRHSGWVILTVKHVAAPLLALAVARVVGDSALAAIPTAAAFSILWLLLNRRGFVDLLAVLRLKSERQ